MKHFYITLFFIVSFFTNAFSQNEFITTWQTTAANEIITIPTTGSGYNYTVDWGDGAIENGFTGNAIHTYVAAGNYTVTITGDFPRIYFNNNGDKSKIYTIEQWGTQVWTSMQNAFFGCPNIVINATDVPDLSNVTNLNQTFLNATELVDNGNKVGDWNVSNITSMRQTFSRTKFNGNINDWDVSNVLSFVRMFQSNIEFNQPLDNWVFSNNAADRINALNMFLEARAFNQDISGWNTRQFETMTNMFFRTDNFNQNLGSWDLTNSTDIANMLVESDMSQANYDATLVGWAMDTSGNISDDIDDIPSNLIFDADATYCVSEAARNTLTSTPYNWTITDGGLDCDFTNAFNTTWQTTAGNESITIPTTGNGYNYAVDWGDGSAIEIGFTGDATHSYTTAGTYTIKIIGDFPRVYFNNAGDKDKIIAITQWGNQQWTSMEAAFYGCANVIVDASDSPDLSMAVSTRAMFRGATNLIDPQGTIANWNVQTILDFGQMFMDTEKFNTPLNNWRFNVAEDLSEMFRGTKVFNQPLSLVSSTVKTLEGIFRDAIAYNQPIPWYTPSVTNLKDMFNGATSFDQNIGFFIIKDVTDMSGMFSNAGLSTENYDQTLSGWFVELNATDIRPDNIVFDGGSSQYCMAGDIIEKLENDHGWQITDSGASCDENDFFIMTWDLTTETGFRMPTSGNGYDYLLSFSNGNIYHMTSDALQVGYAENIGIFTVRIYGDFPRFDFDVNSVNKEKLVAIEQWGSLQLSEVTGAFEGCTNLKLNAIDTPDLSGVDSTVSMFRSCTNLEDLQDKMNDWDMSTIENTSAMFERCSIFNEFIGNWTVDNVENMNDMFQSAIAFNQDLSNWNTSKVIGFEDMFLGASSFNQSLGAWDISTAGTMEDMFFNAGLSQENYDATLIGWATLEAGETQIPANVTLDANIAHCLSVDAVNTLTSAPFNWSINDLGNSCPEDAFITTWSVGDGEEIILGTLSTLIPHNYSVDWGDGSSSTNQTGDATHTYATEGTYTVKVLGEFPAPYYGSIDDAIKARLQTIEQWGTQQWLSLSFGFSNCTNLKLNADDIPDLSQIRLLNATFKGCTNFEDLKDKMGTWDMDLIEDAEALFEGCSIFNESIGGWTLGAVEKMNDMFQGAIAFNQSLANWDISAANNMRGMLVNSGMSQENYDATLIGWATLEAGETQIPVDLTLDASTFYCLSEAERNTLINAPYNWTINDAGKGCPEDFFITTWQTTVDSESITITTSSSEIYNYSVDWGDGTIEGGFTGDATHTYTTAGTYTVKINGDFPRISFENKEQLLYIEQWGTQQWTSMFNAFSGCTNLKLNATDTPDLSQVTSMSSMFRDCTNLEDLKDTMNSWDMTTIERISYMFGNCTLFDENIGNWTFTNLGSSFSAFNGATAFNQDISNWNMSTVDDMESMFKNATSFNQPIGSWTLGVVDYINDFFAGATSFNQDVSNWDFSNVYEAYDMFNGASSFNQDLSAWDISNVESLGDFFTGTAMSTENYDQTLIGWATLEVGETQIPANLTMNADATYCLSEAARNTLTSAPYNWTINDGGSGCPTPVITLLGDNPQTIEQGDVYVELGAEVTYSAILTIDAAAVNTDQVGTYTVTYNATNGSGASATQLVRTIEVVDTTAPVITLNGANPQIIELGDPYIELGATTDDGSPITFDTFISVLVDSVGTYSAMYVSVDAYGNSTTIFRVVEVVDTTAPVITLIGPNPQIIELGDGYTELGATTDDGSPITLDTQVIPDEVGTYSIMYFSADVYNNSTTVFRTVEVVDTTNPTLVCQNITIQLDDTGNATMTANQIDNGTMDLSGIASLVIDVTDFDCSDVGDNMVLLTATDGNGNSESCMATVTVEDNVNPVFNPTTVPDDIEVTFDTGDMYTLADFTVGVEATDNCDTNRSTLQTTITQSPAPGTLLGVGDHVITLTITDDNSNEETATFTITVSDILSVDENTKDIFTLYPNPTKDLVWISGLNNTGRLTIYDVDGRSLKVMEVVNNQSLSTLDLPDGVYFIRIDQGNSSQTLKLIKN